MRIIHNLRADPIDRRTRDRDQPPHGGIRFEALHTQYILSSAHHAQYRTRLDDHLLIMKSDETSHSIYIVSPSHHIEYRLMSPRFIILPMIDELHTHTHTLSSPPPWFIILSS